MYTNNIQLIYIYILLGGFNHLEKYESMGRIIPYIMENKIHVWNHQSCILTYDWFRGHFPTRQCVKTNRTPSVNIKIAGKWMFIPLKMVLIGIDPYPPKISFFSVNFSAFAKALGRCQVCADRLQGSGTGTVYPGQPWRRSHGGISWEGSFDGFV